jgi:hypothetical protein
VVEARTRRLSTGRTHAGARHLRTVVPVENSAPVDERRQSVRTTCGVATRRDLVRQPERRACSEATSNAADHRASRVATSREPADRETRMHPDTRSYNEAQAPADREICDLLAWEIDRHLPEAENRIWHAHPVWFLDGNPVVGYSKLKNCVRLLFWSGRSFDEDGLKDEGTFKAAEARYTAADQVDMGDLARWLGKARDIQWDYRNLIRRKGRLERLK